MPFTSAHFARLTAVFCVAGLSMPGRALGAQVGGHGSGSGARTVAIRGTVEGTDIVRAARRYLGVRYVLGGSTPAAFDCSGFVRYVFGEFGIPLPRTAHEQAAVGDAPFPGDLRPGDLLFFYGGRGAQHIAIYVGGDTIVHASSTGRRVKLDRLSGSGAHRSWFNRRLIAVRRVAPVEGIFRLPAGGGPPPTRTTVLAASTTARAVSGDSALSQTRLLPSVATAVSASVLATSAILPW